MADWRKLAKAALLADGRIDTREVKILRRSLFADNEIDEVELQFIKELHDECESYDKAFGQLFIDVIKTYMLVDGVITSEKTKWLRKAIFADNTVDAAEKQLLEELKAEATSFCNEFKLLYEACTRRK